MLTSDAHFSIDTMNLTGQLMLYMVVMNFLSFLYLHVIFQVPYRVMPKAIVSSIYAGKLPQMIYVVLLL